MSTRAAEDVRRGVVDQGHVAQGRQAVPLGALDGVVRRHVDVGGIRREFAFGVGRDPVERRALGQAGHVHVADAPGLLDGLLGPGPGVDVVRGRALGQQVHRDHRELEAGPTLEEQDPVAVRHPGEPSDVGLGLADDRFEGRRTVADLHDGHPDAGQADEIALDLFEDGQGQHRRPGREVVDAFGGGHGWLLRWPRAGGSGCRRCRIRSPRAAPETARRPG